MRTTTRSHRLARTPARWPAVRPAREATTAPGAAGPFAIPSHARSAGARELRRLRRSISAGFTNTQNSWALRSPFVTLPLPDEASRRIGDARTRSTLALAATQRAKNSSLRWSRCHSTDVLEATAHRLSETRHPAVPLVRLIPARARAGRVRWIRWPTTPRGRCTSVGGVPSPRPAGRASRRAPRRLRGSR